jgi:hypothetical protein
MVFIYLKYATTTSLQVGNFLVGGGGGFSDVTVEWISKRENQFCVCSTTMRYMFSISVPSHSHPVIKIAVIVRPFVMRGIIQECHDNPLHCTS